MPAVAVIFAICACAFTKVRQDSTTFDRKITVSVLNWSDSTGFLILSWADCAVERSPTQNQVFRCQLKPGYEFK